MAFLKDDIQKKSDQERCRPRLPHYMKRREKVKEGKEARKLVTLEAHEDIINNGQGILSKRRSRERVCER